LTGALIDGLVMAWQPTAIGLGALGFIQHGPQLTRHDVYYVKLMMDFNCLNAAL
jgi:hypothetical protein